MQRSVASIPIVPIWAQIASGAERGEDRLGDLERRAGVGEHRDDDVGALDGVLGPLGDGRAVLLERAGAVGRAVPDAHGQARSGRCSPPSARP